MRTALSHAGLYNVSPLLCLETARYKLTFTSRYRMRTLEIAPLLRGRIGYILKGRFCPFPDFGSRSCTDCIQMPNCLYIKLFSPTPESIDPSNLGTGKSHGKPPRPYALDGISPERKTAIQPGQKGEVNLTLFGREAIVYRRPFLEAVYHAATTLCSSNLRTSKRTPGRGNHLFEKVFLQKARPGQPFIYQEEDRFMSSREDALLFDWINCLASPILLNSTSGEAVLEIRLRSPFQFKRGQNRITFTKFLKAVVSRLKDLKRIYHRDNDMGTFPNTFYSLADTVSVFSDLSYEEHTWYSHHQKKRIYLNGFTGNLVFKGNLDPFVPIIAAGYFLGLGRKTVYGLGRFDISGWP